MTYDGNEIIYFVRQSIIYRIWRFLLKFIYIILGFVIPMVPILLAPIIPKSVAGILILVLIVLLAAGEIYFYLRVWHKLIVKSAEKRFRRRLKKDGFTVDALFVSVIHRKTIYKANENNIMIAFDIGKRNIAVMFMANPFEHYIFPASAITDIYVPYAQNSPKVAASFGFVVCGRELIIPTGYREDIDFGSRAIVTSWSVFTCDRPAFDLKLCSPTAYETVKTAMELSKLCIALKNGIGIATPFDRMESIIVK